MGPAQDADGNNRVDDLGTLNTGNGVFRFYDLGAFEFVGSSSDVTPPVVTALVPVGLVDNAVLDSGFDRLIIRFSEPLDAVSARSLSLYHLVEAGSDDSFDTGDDVPVSLVAANYTTGDIEVTLVFGASLGQGRYRLTLGTTTEVLVDRAGNALDGDNNGTPGGNFVRHFRINLAPSVLGTTINDGSVQRSRISSVTVQFSENVSASLAAGDFLFSNLTTATDINSLNISLAYDPVHQPRNAHFPRIAGPETSRMAITASPSPLPT